MSEKKIRYVIDESSAFALHGEGLSMRAVTRKSEVPVTIEIEGITRKVLLQFQAAIEQELSRREESWRRQREQLLRQSQPATVEEEVPPAGEPSAA